VKYQPFIWSTIQDATLAQQAEAQGLRPIYGEDDLGYRTFIRAVYPIRSGCRWRKDAS